MKHLTLALVLVATATCSNRVPPEQPNDAATDPNAESAQPVESPEPDPTTSSEPATLNESAAPPPADRSGDAAPVTTDAASPAPYDVAGWDTIVRTYVTADGGFRYAALRANTEHRALLEQFVQTIGSSRPDEWSRDDQLAFYINAYNALTINSVLVLWPVESVMRERGFFRARQHGVAGQQITLDHLENQIIRTDRFADSRIHFVVNCASVGCPPLAPHALTAANLEETLARNTQAFVRNNTRINRGRNHVLLSQIFEWFAGDFERLGGVKTFVSSQLEGEDAEFVRARRTAIGHFRYDWTLNGRE